MIRVRALFSALALAAACGMLAGCPYSKPPPAPGAQAAAAAAPQAARDAAERARGAIVVADGDTLWRIARRHGVPLEALAAANGLRAPYALRPGQRLALPKPEPSAVYLVAADDTLSAIARRFGTGYTQLAHLNGLEPPYVIRPGQRLRVPGAAAPAAAAPEAAPRTAAAPAPLREPPPLSAPGGRSFRWPVEGPVLSRFGPREGIGRNDGINIAAARGAPVRAAENGVVVYAGNELRSYGNLLLIRHRGGWTSAYAHNGELLVDRGAAVERGQIIARVGSTGGVSEPQSHFELRKDADAVDPLDYLVRR